MNSLIPTRKLLRISASTSAAIGLITIGPVYMVAITMMNLKIPFMGLAKILCMSVMGISLFSFVIWLINIALLYFTVKRTYFLRRNNNRYIWSYLLCFFPLLLIRLAMIPLLNDPVKVRHIIEWKAAAFGISPANFDYRQFTNWPFQIMIMIFVVFSVNSVVLIIQDLILLREKKTIIENENIRLNLKNVEAANQKLKQQLQPHFLFNSLNALKTLIRKHPDHAETYLKRLSDFLRTTVLYDNVNTVRVEDELKFSLDYLEMQKIRFGKALQYNADIPEEMKAVFLPVFSIQMLLENAIKHNSFTPESPLKIAIHYDQGWIIVSNNVQHKNSVETSTGMGLNNLSERYRIISGHDIVIQADESAFSVRIKILDHENRDH